MHTHTHTHSPMDAQVEGRGGRTGYKERTFSELRLPVSQLKAEVEFTCTVVVGDHMKNVSTSISAYCKFSSLIRGATSLPEAREILFYGYIHTTKLHPITV